MTTKNKLIAGACVFCILLVVFGYLYFKPVETKLLMQTKPLVKSLPTETKVLPVKVVTKKATESLLHVELPEGHSVTATADLKPSKTGYEVVSVIDENTGVTTIQQHEKKQDILEFPMTGRVRAGGIMTNHGLGIRGAVELTPLRVGDVYFSVETGGTVYTEDQSKNEVHVGAFAELRW